MTSASYRAAIAAYILEQAQPPDKYSHQPRLYALARDLGRGVEFDDEVLYAAAWLHDLGVFAGHRPASVAELARWDHVAYAMREAPVVLSRFHFPADKVPAVVEAIRTHLPSREPTTFEGTLLRDADVLEQLGAVGITRALSKIGRDTRYPTHVEALQFLWRNLQELPQQLRLSASRELATERLAIMKAFLISFARESQEVETNLP